MPQPAARRLRVPIAQLRRTCDTRKLQFKTTRDLEPLEGTVGQERAVRALDFGLSIEAEGFHVYVSGPPGTGRSTELLNQLRSIAAKRQAPNDWCYVFNFKDPTRPNALSLRPGRGHELGHDVDDLVTTLRAEVPRAFESDEYAQRRDQVGNEVQAQREQFFAALEREANGRELTVNVTPMGINTVPLVEGKPITKEQFDQLADDRKRTIQQKMQELESIISQMAPQLRRLDRGAHELLAGLDRQVMVAIAQPRLEELKRDYHDEPAVVDFLDALGADVIEHIDDFRAVDETARGPAQLIAPAASSDAAFTRYKVNVLITHDPANHAPIVQEDNPSYYHLFGRMDYRASFGSMATDHTMIKPGALHRANGGYLVLHALDVLQQPMVWDTLKRALRTGLIRLENMGDQISFIPTATLSPRPIPLDVKVALIGTPRVFAILQNADEDFSKLFKARADFAIDVDRSDAQSMVYARFIARQAQVLGMRPFDRAAVATIVEQSSRMVADQRKLSLRMKEIVDLLVESDYWACEQNSKIVKAAHVAHAIEQRVYRSSLVEDRVQEFIAKGVIKVDTRGSVVGQVNGLSVYDLGDYAFGRPSRITARVSMGRGQVLNIEREVQRSGSSHSKGFLILQGYMNGQFAHRRPLSFAASITFEQVYDEVDGDSASSTELYALLSAISDIPLSQGIAVTGSVNQLGQVQAIGGVNEKVEGFYAVCKAKGLTGDQGVLIPADNVPNLMLKPEVIDAVKAKRFNIWAVNHIEEGIELLTGVPAGKVKKDGSYPEGTLFRKVTDMLDELTKRAMEVNRGAREQIAPTSASPEGARNGREQPDRKIDKPKPPPRRRVRKSAR